MATNLRTVDLTPTQAKQWDDTRVALMWHTPAFAHIFYTMMDNTKNGSKEMALFTPDVPIAATDGSTMILNPETFFKFNLNERIFVCAHEILHCILDHCVQGHHFQRQGKVPYTDGKSLDYDHEQMNRAQDYVINDILIESKVGAMPKVGLADKSIGQATDAALDVYRKLYKNKPPSGGGGGFDTTLPPGTGAGVDPGKAAAGRDATAWDVAMTEAMNSARAQGKLPAALERLLGELLSPVVDWADQIRAEFARKVGSGGYDWRRPDRRMITRDIYAPGRSGFAAGDIVVAIDTSGSIGPSELNRFFAEMAGILEDVNPKRMVVMWCDARVDRVDELEDAGDLATVRAKKVPGGGGTAFEPVFEEVRQMGLDPEMLVYMTDGYGSFPKQAPTYPVIWADIAKGAVKYPFGKVIEIPA